MKRLPNHIVTIAFTREFAESTGEICTEREYRNSYSFNNSVNNILTIVLKYATISDISQIIITNLEVESGLD